MTALEWLLWAATVWSVFLAYAAVDIPALCARAGHLLADHIRHGGTR